MIFDLQDSLNVVFLHCLHCCYTGSSFQSRSTKKPPSGVLRVLFLLRWKVVLFFLLRGVQRSEKKVEQGGRCVQQDPYSFPYDCLYLKKKRQQKRVSRFVIYDPGSRFATTPPPLPPHGMVPKPAFCSILHENVVFAVFLALWLAGAVCKPANLQEFLQPTFRKRVICNVRA